MSKHKVTIQICSNCKAHAWCTRHDQNTYLGISIDLTKYIKQQIPGIEVQTILVSGSKMGSFQVACDGYLLFSKLTLGYYPHITLLTKRIIEFVNDSDAGNDLYKYKAGNFSPIKSYSTITSPTKRPKTSATSKRTRQKVETDTGIPNVSVESTWTKDMRTPQKIKVQNNLVQNDLAVSKDSKIQENNSKNKQEKKSQKVEEKKIQAQKKQQNSSKSPIVQQKNDIKQQKKQQIEASVAAGKSSQVSKKQSEPAKNEVQQEPLDTKISSTNDKKVNQPISHEGIKPASDHKEEVIQFQKQQNKVGKQVEHNNQSKSQHVAPQIQANHSA